MAPSILRLLDLYTVSATLYILRKMNVDYRLGNDLDVDVVIELYRASRLGERRPIEQRNRMKAMLENANLVVTAWDGNLLIGISRSVTDFVYGTYLSDLAVRLEYQKKGIGKELILRTQQAAPAAMINFVSRAGCRKILSADWIYASSACLDSQARG